MSCITVSAAQLRADYHAVSEWSAVVAALAGRRLLVLGDVMLDEYVSGEARRVCPEAPVPVVEASRRWSVPGGAANAAANAAALRGRPVLGGVTGDDPAAAELARVVCEAGVDPAGLLADLRRPTTTKLRVLARGQQITRVDTELTDVLSGEPAGRLAAWAERTVDEVDAVLLSDYGKGLFADGLARRVIDAALRCGRPVVVDPKGNAPERYRGATVVKPNLSELGDLAGCRIQTEKDLCRAGLGLVEQFTGTMILVTRGAEGMALFRSGQPPLSLRGGPTQSVYDVTGAGDTAAATLALGLAAGWSVELAARVANVAGGVAVCKVGTAVVAPNELLAALEANNTPDFVPFD